MYFVSDRLDYDKSKPTAQWFCKQWYSNFCMRVHFHIDWLAMDPRPVVRNSTSELIDFIKTFTLIGDRHFLVQEKLFEEKPGKLTKQMPKSKKRRITPRFGERLFTSERPAEADAEADDFF